MRFIVVYSCYFCYLYDRKMDEGFRFIVIRNSSFKITKLEIGVSMSKSTKGRGYGDILIEVEPWINSFDDCMYLKLR
jgi:hypothetical protein